MDAPSIILRHILQINKYIPLHDPHKPTRYSYNRVGRRVITVRAFFSDCHAITSGGRYSRESASLFSRRAINFFIFPLLFCFLRASAGAPTKAQGNFARAPNFPIVPPEGKVDGGAFESQSRDNNRDYGNRKRAGVFRRAVRKAARTKYSSSARS